MSVHDFGMPHTYSDEYIRPLKDIREENDQLVAAWLAKGNMVQQVPRGVSGLGSEEIPNNILLRMPSWQRKEYYKRRAMMTLEDIVLEDEHVARVETLEKEVELVSEMAGRV